MKVLVTGATGFVGRHLVWRLASMGDDVTCLVRATSDRSPLTPYGVQFQVGDVTRPETLAGLCEGFEVVYHVAGALGFQQTDDDWLFTVNRDGVAHIAAACAACTTPPVLLVVSSLAAAGVSTTGQPRTEAEPCAPVSAYGRSKLAGEQAARAYADRVPITIVRPPIVYGEGDTTSFELFKLAAKGWHLVPTWRTPRFSMVHVADLVHGMVRLAEHGGRVPAGTETTGAGVYFVADPEIIPYAEFGRRIGAAFDTRVRVIRLPTPLTLVAAAAAQAWGRVRRTAPLLTIDKAREGTAGDWICSGQKAVDELNLKLRVDLDARLRQTAAWYRQAGWLSG